MRILVTGASGFIGSTLVTELANQGHEVSCLLRETSSIDNLKGVHFTRLTGDLRETASLERACQNTEVIFHLAGLTAAKNREEFFKYNAEGTKNLAQAALKAGVKKFIYVSSLAASGPAAGLSPRLESDPEHPVSMYGESKLRGELYLDELKGQLPFVVIRPPLVYGPRDKNIFLFFKTIQKQWMPILPSRSPTGHKYYSAIHVDDLVQSLVNCLKLADASYQTGERFFVSDGQIYTYDRIMGIIAGEMKIKPIRLKIPALAVGLAAGAGTLAGKILKKNLPLNLDKLQELNPDYWICSSQKAYDQLALKPKYTLESGIAQTLAWYKMNGWM
jgi:dihydroflavonol-4-reductase